MIWYATRKSLADAAEIRWNSGRWPLEVQWAEAYGIVSVLFLYAGNTLAQERSGSASREYISNSERN